MNREWGCRPRWRHPLWLLILVSSLTAACGAAATPPTNPAHKTGEAMGTALSRPAVTSTRTSPSVASTVPSTPWYGDQLSEGDCFNDALDAAGEYDYSSPPLVVECDLLHDNEVIATYRAPVEESYPGDESFEEDGDRVCREAYRGFVGVEEGPLEWFSLWPLEDEWDQGGRQAICAVFLPDGPVIGSMRDSGLSARPAEVPVHAPVPPEAVFDKLDDTEDGTRVGMFLISDSGLEPALAATAEAAAKAGGDLVVVGTTGTLLHLEYTVDAESYPIVIRHDNTGVIRWWIYYPPKEG